MTVIGKPRLISLRRQEWGVEIAGTDELAPGTVVTVRTARGRTWKVEIGEAFARLPESIVYRRESEAVA